MNIVALFSGAGGLDRGALDAGMNVIQSHELDKAACATYEKVCSHPIQQTDLTQFDWSKLPDHNLMIGGPPCQEFSISGNMKRENGACNLFPQTIEAVRVKRPDWFLFENVPALVPTSYFQVILKEFQQLGYQVTWRVLNAADFGVPQTRERIFIAGGLHGKWRWPEPTHRDLAQPDMFGALQWVGWDEAIKDVLPDERKFPFWLASRIKPEPDTALFSRQLSYQQRPTPVWRVSGRPAYTVTAHTKSQGFPIRYQGKEYRADERVCAALQTMPYVPGITCKQIGNSVPPLLAKAIFSAMVNVT